MQKQQKLIEKFLVREFLEKGLGLAVRRLLGRRPPRPDCYAVLDDNGRPDVVEIELVEYHLDTGRAQKGGSPGVRLHRFWRKVQDSLIRRLRRKHIEVEVSVALKDAPGVKNANANQLAAELVQFARCFSFPRSQTVTVQTFGPVFPLLTQYVRTLSLTKVNYYSILWACTNTSVAFVGLLPHVVADLIRKKAEKTYQWAKNAQKWLLVCASGEAIVGTAGPRSARDTYRDSNLHAIAEASPFERVYFWDRMHNWYVRLK